MSGFNQEMSKSGGKSGSRLGFLRTKKVLATLSLLVVVAVILIVTTPDRRQFPGSIANGTALRIMPLGASTVRGENSPGNTGFRKLLRDALVALNVPVNMVGSQQVGDFADNDVEAYLGVRVSQIHERSKEAVRQYKPNVFVINAGINNALMNFELDTAGQDMGKFIRDLLTTSPRALVVLSTLTPSRIPHCEPLILNINHQFLDLYARLHSEGLPVVVADVHYAGQEPDALQLSDITDDGTHPTGEGYKQLARIYTKAIQRADSSGFLQVPVPLAGVPDDGVSPCGCCVVCAQAGEAQYGP
ncbi:hypothetical protein PG994_004078 [Apiospora phragmitis]|uniref:SGNH hydrolase-type esterase domain-containing protein n=1 Tax=Apiospora phragmitis TaxID=2905665 RepID=A0ABR1VPJ9_9PEZI